MINEIINDVVIANLEAPLDITLEGSSMMPGNSSGEHKPAKTTSKSKKVKQTFGKFKAPVKAKVTPAKVLPRAENDDEESSKKRLEEVLGISVSDDPRKNPGNYVSIGMLNSTKIMVEYIYKYRS